VLSLLGLDWTQEELIKRVGNMDQLAGIRLVEAADGKAKGSRLFQVWTGSGLTFNVTADRALDISSCSYKGIALAWNSMVGDVHPAYYEPQGAGWLRSFPGGLLATCGLDQYGLPCSDGDEAFGVHGRISNTPARYVSYRTFWEDNDYNLEITGEVRQTRVFGENLVMRRSITTRLGSKKVSIRDTVTNEAFVEQPHMILYHFNLGFPLLSACTQIHIDAELSEPRDDIAASGAGHWQEFQTPTPGYQEQVFHHVPRADDRGQARIEVENPGLELGVRFTFDTQTLGHVYQWKMPGEGMYVLGIEPSNCKGVMGRAATRESGDLPILAPGESVSYSIDVEVIEYSA
jgi:hypothetical protein